MVFNLIAFQINTQSIPGDKKKVPISMAVENVKLMHKCFPKHLCMGTSQNSKYEIRQRNKGRKQAKKV